MSIQLAERAVDQVLALLRAELPGHLSAIDAEKGDFILPKTSHDQYHNYELRERGTHTAPVRIEVYEDNAIEIVDPETDLGTQRVITEIPVIVRATIYNSQASPLDEALMWTARRRYESAIVRVFKETYENPNGDLAITLMLPTAWSHEIEVTAEGIEMVTTTVTVTVTQEECPT